MPIYMQKTIRLTPEQAEIWARFFAAHPGRGAAELIALMTEALKRTKREE